MKLTDTILYKLGFRGEGRDVIDTPAYRLRVDNYGCELQIVLGDYPESNPNSGVLALYKAPVKDMHLHTDSRSGDLDYVYGEEEGIKCGIKYIDSPEMIVNIAWHVTTLERLNEIYTALTKNSPLVLLNVQASVATESASNSNAD